MKDGTEYTFENMPTEAEGLVEVLNCTDSRTLIWIFAYQKLMAMGARLEDAGMGAFRLRKKPVCEIDDPEELLKLWVKKMAEVEENNALIAMATDQIHAASNWPNEVAIAAFDKLTDMGYRVLLSGEGKYSLRKLEENEIEVEVEKPPTLWQVIKAWLHIS